MRPESLKEYIGQERIKQILGAEIKAARASGKPLRHMLLTGMAGTGKTSLAGVVANESGYTFRTYTASKDWTPQHITQELLSLDVTGYTKDGRKTGQGKTFLLFFDECHRMPTASWEAWYSALEDYQVNHLGGASWLPYFTWVGASTSNNLPKPLRDRIGMQFRMDPYTQAELVTIVLQNFPTLDKKVARDIAARARNTPRIALSYTESFLNYGGMGVFDLMGIDGEGLTELDRGYIEALRKAHRPLSLNTLSSMLREDQATLAETVEPFLLERGDILISSKGRELAVQESLVRGIRQPEVFVK